MIFHFISINSARVCIHPYVLLKLIFCLQNGLKIYHKIHNFVYLFFLFFCVWGDLPVYICVTPCMYNWLFSMCVYMWRQSLILSILPYDSCNCLLVRVLITTNFFIKLILLSRLL